MFLAGLPYTLMQCVGHQQYQVWPLMTSQGPLRDSTFVSFSHPGGLKIGSEFGFPQYTYYEVVVRLKSILHVALTSLTQIYVRCSFKDEHFHKMMK